MLSVKALTAIAVSIVALSPFGLTQPLMQAQAQIAPVTTLKLTPIPSPASCTYAGHPTNPLSQTFVSVPGLQNSQSLFLKHAEKEIYDCIVSGFPGKHYILDATTYTTSLVGIGMIQSYNFVVCAKDPATGLVYSCQTEPVGNKLAQTSSCSQLNLASPQIMNTLVVNGDVLTMESQKEIFRCSTPTGPVIQEVIIWTASFDVNSSPTQGFYGIQTCQKPVASTVSLPLLNCAIWQSVLAS